MDRWNTFFNAQYCTEYDEDILQTLKECETRRMNVQFISPQLQHRQSSVKLILNVCKQQSYRRATVHLAIYLLDVFMSNHTIAERRLNLVALTCLYLACKIEENEPKVPSPTRLNGFLANLYRPADFIALEVTILCFFDWHITIPTASTFLDIFMHAFGQQHYDATSGVVTIPTSWELFLQRINETSSTILEATLQHFKLCTIQPSLLAAGCIAAARCLTPGISVWSIQLASATGYEYSQIHEVCQMLLFEAMPQSPSSSLSSTPKRSISDAGYLSERWESDEDEENANNSSNISSNTSGRQDSDSTSSSTSSSSMCKECFDSESVCSDTGERGVKKRKMTVNE
uniref:Cyclin N-terminal domain-containing protein n=1 Tax=Anopheles christyi TaxID=43041 RepID=A0A182JUA7_9DIPT